MDNKGSRGPFYLRADIVRAWGDAFGGRTRVAEGYAELNLPLVSEQPWHRPVDDQCGRCVTRRTTTRAARAPPAQSATQGTLNWKFQTEFEPFDWVRLRMTRSRDLRAAGYRDLFLNQPGIPDQALDINPWRDRTADSAENQYERWGFVRVGNTELRPEKSDTLTLGLVLSPGGWARGMRMSIDYYTIRVKRRHLHAVQVLEVPLRTCWEHSGNVEAHYMDGVIDLRIRGATGCSTKRCRSAATYSLRPTRTACVICRTSWPTTPAGRPTTSRIAGAAWIWRGTTRSCFRVRSRMLPGAVSLTMRATRALESSGVQQTCGSFVADQQHRSVRDRLPEPVDLVGQVRSSVFVPGVAAAPKWTGHFMRDVSRRPADQQPVGALRRRRQSGQHLE